ncbi:MAG: hypothetical protein JWS10_1840 [Cypionkella sp.]|nr:hypothetical protein [Cypionkella sp.]
MRRVRGLHFSTCTPSRPPLNSGDEDTRRAQRRDKDGAIAQMGERLNGIQEVMSSILIGSTKQIKDLHES